MEQNAIADAVVVARVLLVRVLRKPARSHPSVVRGMQTSTQTLAAETRPPPMNGGLRVETVQAGTGALVKKCPTTLTRQAV